MTKRCKDFVDNGVTWLGVDYEAKHTGFFRNAIGRVERWAQHNKRPPAGERVMQGKTKWWRYVELMPEGFEPVAKLGVKARVWRDPMTGAWHWSTGPGESAAFADRDAAKKDCRRVLHAIGLRAYIAHTDD